MEPYSVKPFRVWLPSLIIAHLRFLHVVFNSTARGANCAYPFTCCRAFGVFLVWGMRAKATVNIRIQVLGRTEVFHASGADTREPDVWVCMEYVCLSLCKMAKRRKFHADDPGRGGRKGWTLIEHLLCTLHRARSFTQMASPAPSSRQHRKCAALVPADEPQEARFHRIGLK